MLILAEINAAAQAGQRQDQTADYRASWAAQKVASVGGALAVLLFNAFSFATLGPQPFEVFADRELLLLIYGQRLFDRTKRVACFLGLLGHDFTLVGCDNTHGTECGSS